MVRLDLKDLYHQDPLRALRLALRRTEKTSSHLRMGLINTLIGGCGVEAIHGDWSNGYWGDVVATYVNMGDTYAPTVICKRTGSSRYDVTFQVNNLGDFVERNEKGLGII